MEGSCQGNCNFLTSSLKKPLPYHHKLYDCVPPPFHFLLNLYFSTYPQFLITDNRQCTMSRPIGSTSRRSRQHADHASPSRISTLPRTPNTRTRRSSVRRHHQIPEEDRFLNLRRSARIAQHQLDQQREHELEEIHQPTTMADVARRTYARNDHGPRGVE